MDCNKTVLRLVKVQAKTQPIIQDWENSKRPIRIKTEPFIYHLKFWFYII